MRRTKTRMGRGKKKRGGLVTPVNTPHHARGVARRHGNGGRGYRA